MPRKYIYKKDEPDCRVAGCSTGNEAGGYCKKHYAQKYTYGGIRRTIHDRNEIVVEGETARVILYDSSCQPIAHSIIDASDIDLVKHKKWHLSGGYARAQSTGIHNVITGLKYVDHINRDPLDNRRCNLRPATPSQNVANTAPSRHKKSTKYKGVHTCNMTKKPWRVCFDGKTVGRYHDEEEAAWMYDQYVLSVYGDYAFTNFQYQSL